MHGTAEKVRLLKIIITKITVTQWDPTMCQDFTNIVLLEYNNSAVKKLFHRKREGKLREFKLHFYNYMLSQLLNEGLRVYLSGLTDFASLPLY